MPKLAIVAALEREVSHQIRSARRVEREYDGHKFVFFEQDEMVMVCGGIGAEPARRAAEAVIAVYDPELLQSVGFAGALQADLRVGDIMVPGVVVDVRDGSRIEIEGGNGVLVTFMTVATASQKVELARAYGAQALDMEAAAVACAAGARNIRFRAVKVISDELDFEMPAMGRFIDARGRFQSTRFALFVALRPWLWRRVALLARNCSVAARMLDQYLKRSRQPLTDGVEAKPSGSSSNS